MFADHWFSAVFTCFVVLVLETSISGSLFHLCDTPVAVVLVKILQLSHVAAFVSLRFLLMPLVPESISCFFRSSISIVILLASNLVFFYEQILYFSYCSFDRYSLWSPCFHIFINVYLITSSTLIPAPAKNTRFPSHNLFQNFSQSRNGIKVLWLQYRPKYQKTYTLATGFAISFTFFLAPKRMLLKCTVLFLLLNVVTLRIGHNLVILPSSSFVFSLPFLLIMFG